MVRASSPSVGLEMGMGEPLMTSDGVLCGWPRTMPRFRLVSQCRVEDNAGDDVEGEAGVEA